MENKEAPVKEQEKAKSHIGFGLGELPCGYGKCGGCDGECEGCECEADCKQILKAR